MSSPTLHRQAGFTLLEIIVALVVVSVVSVVVFQVFGSSFIRSTEPATQLQNAFDLQLAMEEMTAAYMVMAESDDTVTTAELVSLQAAIAAKAYGDGAYTVDANNFVTFDGDNNVVADGSGSNDILRVIISRDTGESLTTLFTTR